MTVLFRWLAPTVLAAAVGIGTLVPAPLRAQDSLTRVLVSVADVIFNNGVPYYRYGAPGYDTRLIVMRDRYGRPLYYRQMPSGYDGRVAYDPYGRRINYNNAPGHYSGHCDGPPYGNAYGYRNNRCNQHGKCWAGASAGRHRGDDDRDDRRERGDD